MSLAHGIDPADPELFDKIEEDLREFYSRHDEIPPRIFLLSKNEVLCMPFGWEDNAQRARLLRMVRMVLSLASVSGYLIVNEAWMAPHHELPSGDFIQPSERLDRVEVVIMTLVMRDGMKRSRLLELQRDAAGKVTKMSGRQDANLFDLGGEFTELFGDTVGDVAGHA